MCIFITKIFKNGSVIIDKDWYLITDNDGKSTKIMGSTNGIKFKLSENITFNPNSIKDTARDVNFPTAMEITLAGRVKKSQHDVYDQRAFGIGFFSALIIQASNITIDLNGYKIEQSFEHALQQRFFSVIELASIPFLPTQGPHTFGSSIKAADRCLITNGTIGRSSHHGIHGNLATNIIIKDIHFENYEVGTISLNGVRNIYVDNIVGKRTFYEYTSFRYFFIRKIYMGISRTTQN